MRIRNLHLQDKHGLLVTFKILLNFYIKWNIFGWYSSTSHNPKKITSVTLSVKVFCKHNDKNRHIKIEAQTYTEQTVRHKCKKNHKKQNKIKHGDCFFVGQLLLGIQLLNPVTLHWRKWFLASKQVPTTNTFLIRSEISVNIHVPAVILYALNFHMSNWCCSDIYVLFVSVMLYLEDADSVESSCIFFFLVTSSLRRVVRKRHLT